MRFARATTSYLCLLFPLLLGLIGSGAAPAASQTSLKFGFTPTSEYVGAYIAAEEGFFKSRGLDVELVLVPLNSNIPSALQAGSLQVGGPTTATFLQAVDGGLDLVAIAGGSMMTRNSTNFSVVGRTAAGLQKPTDFVGKRVGIPGIGALMHVIFRKWLMVAGVDPKKVTFVEVGFPQMPDVIRGGTVDAVLSIEPVTTRILQTGQAGVVTTMVKDLPDDLMIFVYGTTAAFAKDNPETVRKFRDALVDAAAFMARNPDKARDAISKYTKLSLDVVKNVQLPELQIESNAKRLVDWIDIMNEQKMLKGKIDEARLNVR
ncbi:MULTISPECIES: ABC transporter substrate-binding protein [unclassified Bradyrhizobium]|uniref:ABC transporter substrate-binding protein n=1 Tax=unclassified Bradyrhizobium TaxID=2631580 RepID=UPI0023068450|nr:MULTISPECIES: ABC transporter substrate-binding protein [unclassified Bradyrhizobium]MDA9451238.1 hypothetical protein [Bradyrhizobium sp. CCBAU 21360]MDA9457617.1 hypothetical protein [Bradyrhizobium sp. CCBAU 21359]